MELKLEASDVFVTWIGDGLLRFMTCLPNQIVYLYVFNLYEQ